VSFSAPELGSLRCVSGFADQAAHAFMIEEAGHAFRADIDSQAVPVNQGLRMIDFDPLATDELDRKEPKRRPAD